MADYYVDFDGNVTKVKKKRKKADYQVSLDGKITRNRTESPETNSKQGVTFRDVKAEKEKRNWFDRGAFADGYQKGDITKTILGTVTDLNEDLTAGLLGIGEKAVDAGAYLVGMFGGDAFKGKVSEFIEKDLYDEQAIAESRFNPLKGIAAVPLAILGEKADDNSLLGEKSDSLVQSAGQLAGQVALQSAGVPWWVTSGATSFGSEAEGAFHQGAKYGEAGLSAAVSAGAEMLTEKLFGGSALGEKGLIKLEPLTKGIANKAVKALADFGIDVVSEGSEEVVSEVLGRLGSALYKEESVGELLASEEAIESYIESFIGGAVLGGGANSIKLAQSVKNKRDYRSGISSNEQKVVHKEIENRIAEKEKNGKKVDKKTRSEIETEVQEDLKKGYISIDTIERALGGKTYDSYKSLSNEMEEYSNLNKMRAMEMTGEQSDRLVALKEKNKKASYESEKTRLREQLSKEVFDMTANDTYLRESYNEKGRRSQAFEADTSTYDEKMQATVQKAIDSGILNNTRRTHEFVDMIAKISADKGVSFDFTDNAKLKESGFALEGKSVNGFVQNGNVTLNVNSAKALNKVVGHEITHVLEGTEHYAALVEAVKAYAETKGEYQSRYDALSELYKDVEGANIENELTADLIGDYLFSDNKFVQKLSSENRNVFQMIYDEIKYLVKTVTSGSKEAKQLQKVKKIFDEVYRESADVSQNSKAKYSLMEFSEDGRRFVEIDQEQERFEGHDRREYPRIAKDIINEKFNGKVIGIDNQMFVNGQGRDEYANPSKFIQGDVYEAKMRAAGELDNLLDAGANLRNEPDGRDGHYHKDVVGGFDYFDTLFKIGNNYYEATINIKNVKKGKLFKDVTKIKDVTQDIMSSYGQSPKSQFLRTSSTNSISQKQQNTTENQKFSLGNDDIAAIGNWDVKGEDIALEGAPQVEEIAPAQQQDAADEEVAPVQRFEEEISPEDEEEIQLRESDARKIKNIQAKIKGLEMSKDIASKNFDESITKKEAEYEHLKRKDTKKASTLQRQIQDLEARKQSTLADHDRRIAGQKKGIEKIEQQARARQRKKAQDSIRTQMKELIGDTSKWVDKKLGLSYRVNTLRRNLRDVVRDADGNRDTKTADTIYEALQGSYNHNEAELNREANRIKQVFADMKINKRESVYIQMLGEYKYNPDTTLTPEVLKEYYDKYKDKIDTAKVDDAIEKARNVYDNLFQRVNAVLREQGFKEIGYKQGYFPHFMEEQSKLAKFMEKAFNWKTQNNDIPTDIAGLTEQFNPNRSHQSFDKHRTGDDTVYDFLKGMDTYVQGSLDWIYHIEDIQKRRALENEIRYQHSPEGLQKEIDEIRNNPFLDAEEMQQEIDKKYENFKNPLGNFVQDLRKGTNVLAGKKDSADRNTESALNRTIYSTMTNISNRITGNMVAGSISSALTNFIPITQSWGQVSPISSLRAMKDTILSTRKDDGVIDKSDFLTNRLRSADNLYKTGWDKTGEAVGFLMEAVDNFTSQTVWRSKYMENIQRGMSEEEAIKNADQFAENVIAGRSRGNMPTIFNEKNPVSKVLTAFQLEVANQYGYIFKDMPQDMKNEATGKLLKGYATMFLGAYAYNALYSSLTGRDAAFDPVGIVEELLRDLGLFGDDEEEEPADTTVNLVTNLVEEIPFVGGLMGGGRIPISSALPYDGISVDSFTELMSDISEGDWKNLGMEWLNPVYYLLMPMGGGQLKKTVEGLSMFDDDLPIAGSYTNSGKLRYSVEDTPANRIQAGVFGQYANKNAQEYFDEGRTPLNEKKTQELADLDLPISEYWDIQDGLKERKKFKDKVDYIADLDLPIAKKNILVNNASSRKYNLYEDLDEFDFATQNPEKYKVAKVAGGYKNYALFKKAVNGIHADKDAKGETISGSKKTKVVNFINALEVNFGEKIILFKQEYPGDDTYNQDIVNYIDSRTDLTYSDKEIILKELGFTVAADGTVRW